MNPLKDLISKLPIQLLMVAGALYFAYDYLQFDGQLVAIAGIESPLAPKQAQLVQVNGQVAEADKKLKVYQEFFNQLEKKRAEVRELAVKLEGLKATLNDTLDVPAFMEVVVTEAKRSGLTVQGLKPTEKIARDFYEEQVFELSFKGVYVQVMVFLSRLAQSRTLIRADDFQFHPSGNATARYVPLEGTIKLRGFHSIRAATTATPKAGSG